MTTSKMLAGLIGPTLVAIAAAIFCLNLGVFPALAEQVSRDPALSVRIWVANEQDFCCG
jgi:hypothetical protein